MGRDDPPDQTELLGELEDLLLTVARGHTPDRLSSMRYMQHREQLFQGALGAALPGFLVQCVSVARFRTFIELYDSDSAEREGFIRAMLGPARRRLRPARGARFADFLNDGF